MKTMTAAALGAVLLSACATAPMMAADFDEPRQSVKVVLMEPDVEVRFDKVGSTDIRADWSEEAEANLEAAIIAHLEGSGETVVDFDTLSVNPDALDQLLAMNQQVSYAMGAHVRSIGAVPFLGPLPHKKDRRKELTYSLGDTVAPIRAQTDADYAAFLTYRATIESGGSFLTKVALGALTGYTPGGSDFRGTLVNLVDLETGEVVWLNSAVAGSILAGDARNPDNARKTIFGILDKGPFVEASE